LLLQVSRTEPIAGVFSWLTRRRTSEQMDSKEWKEKFGMKVEGVDQKLFQLAYTSQMLVLEDISDIIGSSRRNNPRLQIGGMLWIDSATKKARQVLEGRYQDVLTLLGFIAQDTRHKDMKIEYRKFVEQRSFRKWGAMTLVVTSKLDCSDDNDRLLQVEYTSRMVSKEFVKPVLNIAKIRNQEQKVGGRMWFFSKNSRVRQILEGPEKAVRALLEKIRKDDRHRDFQLNSQIFVSRRKYLQWEARTCAETDELVSGVSLEA
ncbi:hypothetical protein AAMO2058_001116700, partial [Amorphochlora amoebiformis]